MYAIMKTKVMCDGCRVGQYLSTHRTRYGARRVLKEIYLNYSKNHRPEPYWENENTIVLPSSYEETKIESSYASFWTWKIIKIKRG